VRRWLTWDLLTGRVTRDHALFERMERRGLGDRLRAMADAPCPPDIIGVNHYLTSERFLDHRLDRYPPERRGGNDHQVYADVEAVRVLAPPPDGLEGVLREAHARYGLPMAVTEVHNGCTREEQMRWLLEAWRTAQRLREDGVPVNAVTAWSLLGAFDWNSLLTCGAGHYETGVFDVSGPAPRPTGLAFLMKSLASGARPPAVALGAGWWRRDIRLEYAPAGRLDDEPPPRDLRAPEAAPLLLIVGAGAAADAVAHACLWRGLTYRLVAPVEAGIGLDEVLAFTRPWAVVAALEALDDPVVGRWFEACERRGLPFMDVSRHAQLDEALDYLIDDASDPGRAAPAAVRPRASAAE
jgi:dTDP-4-dehydrorhamnose reductase